MSEWKTIETAPEDTEIIIWDPGRNDWFKAWSTDWDITDRFNQPREWLSLDGDSVLYHHPSHWMLPEPPK